MVSETTPLSHSAEQSFHLPAEIIEEILSRVEVRSLLRFRCISKSCRSLIDSKRFIKTHLQNSTKHAGSTHHRVMFNCKESGLIKQCSLPTLLNGPPIDPSSPIDNIPTVTQSGTCCVVGCCNGLVCILLLPGRFLLWNPATRISMGLPKLEHVIQKCGFGWDERSGAYKVFTAVMHNEKRTGKVYSSKTNSWKTVEDRDLPMFDPSGTHVGRKIYWANVGRHDNDIEFFDLETEKFGRIELPFDAKYWRYLWLGEVGGCLCLCVLCNNLQLNVDVWIMKESWLKLLTLPQVCEYKISRYSIPLLGGGANGEILVIYRDTLFVYNPKEKVFSAAKSPISFSRAYVYVESLVSPLPEILN